MIKISKHFYIHWLTPVLFASAYITRTLEITFMMYLVMIIHELAHMMAAIYLRLGVTRFILYPFGVSLRLGTTMLCSFSDCLILYLSGPLVNALIATILLILGKRDFFFFNNIIVFILNLCPIVQLDGGRILEDLLMRKFGYKRAENIMFFISGVTAAGIFYLIIKFQAISTNSISFFAFIIGGLIMQKPKYSRDIVRELSFPSVKKSIKANLLIADISVSKRRLIKEFSPSGRTLVALCDTDGKIVELKTEREIIDSIIK